MQPELQLSGNAATIPTSVPVASSMPSEAPSYSSIQAANSSLMEEDEIKELESGDDFIHVSVRIEKKKIGVAEKFMKIHAVLIFCP